MATELTVITSNKCSSHSFSDSSGTMYLQNVVCQVDEKQIFTLSNLKKDISVGSQGKRKSSTLLIHFCLHFVIIKLSSKPFIFRELILL